jgi:5-methyltetrahydrofolate--homocysteine methyltransferase
MTLPELLKSRHILLADGAWGTQLAASGLAPGDCPELLNAENPDAVRAVAASYADAGSDLVLTNTFGGSPFTLARHGLADRTEELNELGVLRSREGAGDSVLVVASIGPTGEFLAPLGTTSPEELTEGFARQVRAIVRGGADAVVLETMSDLGEVGCALNAVHAESDLPVIVSMTYNKGQAVFATMMGVTPDQAAAHGTDTGADIIGSNCGSGIDTMISVAETLNAATDLPLWIKPNAGLPELSGGKTVYRESPEDMAGRVPELVGNGARIVGGCCGTTPEHIRAFRRVLDGLNA